MRTDREVLVELLDAVEAYGKGTGRLATVGIVAGEARAHLARTSERDCSDEVGRASRAAYAAGQARNAGASP